MTICMLMQQTTETMLFTNYIDYIYIYVDFMDELYIIYLAIEKMEKNLYTYIYIYLIPRRKKTHIFSIELHKI